LAFCLAVPLAAATASPDPQQSATRQREIRQDSQSLVARLDDVIAEYKANGLDSGADFDSLQQVRAELGSLTQDEMAQLITLLQQMTGDPHQLAKAYSTGKDIALRLQKILAAHQHQQDLQALSSEVRQLADRQSANLSTAIEARQLAAQDSSPNGHAAVAASEQAQQSEQSAISQEVQLVSGKLAQLHEPALNDAAAQLGKVPAEASAAADALGNDKLDDAMDSEKSAREQLEQVAQALSPASVPPEPAEDQQAAQLANLAKDQRALLAKTAEAASALAKAADAQSPAATDKAMYEQIAKPSYHLAQQLAQAGLDASSPPEQIRNSEAVKNFLQSRAAALEKQAQTAQSQLSSLSASQAALAAKAQMIREDLQKTASVPMANAVTQMNSAQNSLAEGDGDQAMQEETDAASQLDQAQQIAAQNQQAAGAQAGQAESTNPDWHTRQLQNGVNDVLNRERASLQQGDALKTGAMAAPAARAQDSLASTAQNLAHDAAAVSSPSAPGLQSAAESIQSAAQMMRAGGVPTQAEAAQQSAIKALNDAAGQLAQQAAAADQQKQEVKQLHSAMNGLQRVIEQQQQLGMDTQRAAAQGKTGPAVSQQIAHNENRLRDNADKLRQSLAAAPPDAARALDQASAAMGDAAQKLNDSSVSGAQARQQDALSALYKAQDSLADQIQKLGGGQPSLRTESQIMSALQRAQSETGAAQQALSASGAGQFAVRRAASQFGQTARGLAGNIGHPEDLPQAARDALRNAERALGSAETAAQTGDSGEASAQASNAMHALGTAQSAISSAQSGIAGLAPDPSQSSTGADSAQAGQAVASQPAQTAQATGMSGNRGARERSWSDMPGASVSNGAVAAGGAAAFTGLPGRDRAAIQQSQAEKYPQEYGAMIEAYMRSLSSDATAK
jgi:hypothetical protein